jgi:hypothetical protein
LILLILNELYGFLSYSKRFLGNLTARNLKTFGHLIGSINLISPYSALKDYKLIYIPLRIAVSSSYEAEGLI